MKIQKLILILYFLNAASLYSNNFFFSESTGNDAWSGTRSTPNGNNTDGPKRSITALNNLLNTLAQPGDSVFLKRGDRWSGPNGILTNTAQGTTNNYIFVGAYGTGNKPIIDKTGLGEVLLCRASANAASSYLKFQNLALTSSSPIGSRPVGVFILESFYTLKPHHIILDGLEISNCLSGMILYQHNIIVENCLLEKNGNQSTGHGIFSSADTVIFRNNVLDSNGCGSFFVHTMYISQCTNILFEGNEIRNADDGLKLRSSENLVIKNNVIHDMYIHTIHVGGDEGSGTKNVIIEGNHIYNSPQGIEIKSESGIQTQLSENILIKNNILPAQLIISNSCPVKDIFIFNNLIHSTNNQNALLYLNSPNPVNLQVKNNIFYKTTANTNHALLTVLATSGLNGITLNNNLYYFPSASGNIIRIGNANYTTLSAFRTAFPTQELNAQQGNPNFVSAPGDFHLTAASILAIDKGADLSTQVDTDIEGRERPLDGDGINGTAWDIGPYEFCCFTGSDHIYRKHEFEIFPNPTCGEISIITFDQLAEKIMITNVCGKMLYEFTPHAFHYTLQLYNIENGIYFVQLFLKSGILTRKILLSK
jgi:parallel beta-helix repeat protein